MKQDEENAKVNVVYNDFADSLKEMLEAQVENIDATVKENQIRKFVAAAKIDIMHSQLSRTLNALDNKKDYVMLIDRIEHKNGLKQSIVELANNSRDAVIAIVNPKRLIKD